MIRENRQISIIEMAGGLNLEAPALALDPGSLILCHNFEVKTGGGYRRIGGYERFDGHPSPASAVDSVAARALIQAVPGDGAILGVWIYSGTVYAIRNAAGGASAKLHKATAAGWVEVTTPALSPSGVYQFVNYNFSGASFQGRMFGCDGVNPPFMFDGTTLTQLTVAGATGQPSYIAAHKNHLFLAYPSGQLVHSSLGDPTDYDTVSGTAGLLATGDEITGILPTVGGTLVVFMRNRVSVLYGSSEADWQSQELRTQSDQSGAIAKTIQDVGGDTIYLDDRGLTSLSQSQAFGNYEAAVLDKAVKRLIASRKSLVLGSGISRAKNMYSIYFTHYDGTERISLTFGAKGIEGFGRSVYPFTLSCACSIEDGAGDERILAGSSDGFVYEMDIGPSFDGAVITSYIKPSFGHVRSPQQKKRWRKAQIGLEAQGNLTLRVKPEFDYGSIERAGHAVRDVDLIGGGGQWDNAEWNDFIWSAQIVSEASVDIVGTGRNMALLITHQSADTLPFTIYNVTLQYSLRGMVR